MNVSKPVAAGKAALFIAFSSLLLCPGVRAATPGPQHEPAPHLSAEPVGNHHEQQQQSREKKQQEERIENSYAIYSLLLPGKIFSAMGAMGSPTWAIAQTSINADDINPKLAPEAMLRPPPDNPEGFRQAVEDYDARKNDRITFSRKFHLEHPYVLLTPEEVEDFRLARGSVHSNSSLVSRFRGIPGITYFSEVYFNRKQTAALVYMLDWCGNLCAESQWVYLEKVDGTWVRRSG